MVRVICPSCNSKLNAKDELIGQVRRCPKCSQPVMIVASPTEAVEEPAGSGEQSLVETVNIDFLPVHDRPERLNRESHYFICDRAGVLATWANNGNGWMLRINGGFAPAKRNRDQLPSQGDFQLVEIKFAMTDEGRRLAGLEIFRLASHYALAALPQGDDQIVEKIVGPGCLNRDQKNSVRKALKDQFMRPVWEKAAAVIEFLASQDFHSHRVDASST